MEVNKSNLIVFVDLDATIVNVGTRFTDNPPPPDLEKNRLNPAYKQWLLDIQTPELLAKDQPVAGMQQFVGAFEKSVYLTSRSDIHLNDTLKWLRIHNFPVRPLIMRKEGDTRNYAEFKEAAIKWHIDKIAKTEHSVKEAYNIVLVDDDNKGKLEDVCMRNEWVLLKARSGGEVL